MCSQDTEISKALCGTYNLLNVPSGRCMLFDESLLSKLPDIEVRITSSFSVKIPASIYIRYEHHGSKLCGVFAIFSMEHAPANLVLLGDVFMNSAYVIFDRSTSPARIGFATPNCPTTGTTYAPYQGSPTTTPASGGGDDMVHLGLIIGAALVVLGIGLTLLIVLVRRSRNNTGSATARVSGTGESRSLKGEIDIDDFNY